MAPGSGKWPTTNSLAFTAGSLRDNERMKKRLWTPARFWINIAADAARGWIRHNAFQHAAALAFYTLFSMAPILILVVAGAGMVFGHEEARGEIVAELESMIGEEGAVAVETAIAKSGLEGTGYFSTTVGIVLLLVGATTVFGQLQQSMNDVWNVTPKPTRSSIREFIKTRILSLTLVLTIGFLLLVSLVLSTAVSAIIRFADDLVAIPSAALGGADIAVSLMVITVLFAMIFRILPDVQIGWRDAIKGALVTAVLFIIGKSGISFYLSHTGTASAYGAAGSLVVVLLWVYYSSLILLYGAEFTRAYVEATGRIVHPKRTAVKVRQQIIEETD